MYYAYIFSPNFKCVRVEEAMPCRVASLIKDLFSTVYLIELLNACHVLLPTLSFINAHHNTTSQYAVTMDVIITAGRLQTRRTKCERSHLRTLCRAIRITMYRDNNKFLPYRGATGLLQAAPLRKIFTSYFRTERNGSFFFCRSF